MDGILVQLPLPGGLDAKRALLGIDPAKDVDGLHPFNQGLLLAGQPGLRPCTPSACISMLKAYGIALKGMRAVVLGRSEIVGKPISLMLLEEHATVTIAHSRTVDLPGLCREADLLVAAVGRPGLVEGSWIKPGATVVDVGINRVEDLELGARIFQAEPRKLATLRAKGSVLCGDVRYGEAAAVAGGHHPGPGRGRARSPSPGLMANTLQACAARMEAGAMTYSRRETFLPFTRPMVGAEEIAEIIDSIESGWITTGPKAARFEEALQAYNGVTHCLAMNSATTAQEITMQVLGLQPGRRGDHHLADLGLHPQHRGPAGRRAGAGGHRPGHPEPRPGQDRGGHHPAHQGHHPGAPHRASRPPWTPSGRSPRPTASGWWRTPPRPWAPTTAAARSAPIRARSSPSTASTPTRT